MQIYFCIELLNVIYPTLKARPAEFHAQISIMHETLFVLTDYGGGSQVNPLIDMLLLQTFTSLKEHLYQLEFKKRLPKTLTTILKPKTIEACPGLGSYTTELLLYIRENCLQYMAQDLLATCSGLISPSTRIHVSREVNNLSANS